MRWWRMATMRNNHAYVQRREALRRATIKNGLLCHLCGKPFDMSLPYNDRWAWSADHCEAIANGGSMTGKLMPAHRHCNSSRGRKPLDEYLAEKAEKQPAPARRTTSW